MTLRRRFRILVVSLAPLALAACGGAPGGAGGGAVIADLDPLPPADGAQSGRP